MEPKRQKYKGYRIELRAREVLPAGGTVALRAGEVEGESEPELLINDAKVDYGKLSDGTYFLPEYAYDWTDNLIDLARRFIDHRIKTDEIRLERQSNTGD